jgi:hypothetical protein
VTYLFTRRTRLAPGHGTAGVDWARSVAEKARELTGHELQLWGTMYSPGVGTIWWTGWFETLDTLEHVGDVLAAAPVMEKLTNAAVRYTDGRFDDGLVEPVHGAWSDGPARYAGGAIAVARAGRYADAIAAGVAIAERFEAITGLSMIVGRSMTGRDGAIEWLVPFEDAAAMEAARARVASDTSWLEMLDSSRCRSAFESGCRTTIYRRLGTTARRAPRPPAP